MLIEDIAKVCHESNRAYCETLGDYSQLPWSNAPEWQRSSAINGVHFHLTNEAGPEASHENWLKYKLAEGWAYGPVKDPAQKLHPCCVPYARLPVNQQLKDSIFHAIVHAFKGYEKQS